MLDVWVLLILLHLGNSQQWLNEWTLPTSLDLEQEHTLRDQSYGSAPGSSQEARGSRASGPGLDFYPFRNTWLYDAGLIGWSRNQPPS